jgi:GNAT superfamily N-acetyltransferase
MSNAADVTEHIAEEEIGPSYSLDDFTVKTVGSDDRLVTELNEFFNSPQIKSELHWFTHRDTLERAADRDNRRLLYIRPHETILAGLMVWCESRVLESHQGQIRLVAVDPDHRDYGLGAYLVSRAIDFARSCGKHEMIADVAAEAPAVAFWERTGFSKQTEYETSGGRLMYQMRKSIQTY